MKPPVFHDSEHLLCEMQMGRSLYIVQCHYIGNETLDDKIERLVLRTWEGEPFRSR